MIEVTVEPPEIQKEFGGIMENCFFCHTETRYWHTTSNTPVCRSCAERHETSQLPSKPAKWKLHDKWPKL